MLADAYRPRRRLAARRSAFGPAAGRRPPAPARISADVKVLSSDAFEGRGPPPPPSPRRSPTSSAQMKAAGLQPGGGTGGWTQDVPLARFEMKGPSSSRMTIGGETQALTQGEEIVVHDADARRPRRRSRTRRWSSSATASTRRSAAGTTSRASTCTARSRSSWSTTPTSRPPGAPATFGGKAMTYYGRWTYKYEEAARQGALGMLDHPRDRPGRLRLGHGQELQHQRPVRHRPRRPRQGARAARGLDPARPGASTCSRPSGLDFEAAEEAAPRPRASSR